MQIRHPERFALHKLIVGDRRHGGPDQAEARKDRGQAAFLISILAADRPGDLADALEDAVSRGPRWRQRISASLAHMPDTAEILSKPA
ncbi:GSU2403 family nucleotidyltransferase fold protein [Loktanella sp. DJP18]|uniref:GSU2403 family nucleotidyltransferase fold protein n=1 Tax=Loktanella sp. DJP18 TaxID=3409788 RepID=UPI003BB7176F